MGRKALPYNNDRFRQLFSFWLTHLFSPLYSTRQLHSSLPYDSFQFLNTSRIERICKIDIKLKSIKTRAVILLRAFISNTYKNYPCDEWTRSRREKKSLVPSLAKNLRWKIECKTPKLPINLKKKNLALLLLLLLEKIPKLDSASLKIRNSIIISKLFLRIISRFAIRAESAREKLYRKLVKISSACICKSITSRQALQVRLEESIIRLINFPLQELRSCEVMKRFPRER